MLPFPLFINVNRQIHVVKTTSNFSNSNLEETFLGDARCF